MEQEAQFILAAVHAYPGGKLALRGVSFRITHGEAVAIIGANGAGKSTLLSHLNGCFFPQKGSVYIGELPVNHHSVEGIRRTVGTVFQDADDQLFMPTVYEDVSFGPLNMGFPPEECAKRVKECLERVEAWHLRDRPPYRLSGGEKRRVAIATALAMGPSLLILDEPTTGLDPRGRRQLIQLLQGFTHTRIIASHDLDLVLDLCPRTLVMKDGAIAADGPTRDLFTNPELLAACHLEQPLRLQGCPNCSTPH
ncbi:MAG: ABC transporter ATP-binding protein [Magnetococcales bacterium]|nr:ABC transporter ATP-binding protein [Magnetococcales bacterium]